MRIFINDEVSAYVGGRDVLRFWMQKMNTKNLSENELYIKGLQCQANVAILDAIPELVLQALLHGITIDKNTIVYLGEIHEILCNSLSDGIRVSKYTSTDTPLADLILSCNQNIYDYEQIKFKG